MVLVDTSVWIDHLRHNNPTLVTLLHQQQVCIHPMIIGELACGNLRNRDTLLLLWQQLSQAVEATHEETMLFLQSNRLMGRGIGFIDLHLLSSTLLTPHCRLWSLDKRLANIATELKVSFSATKG